MSETLIHSIVLESLTCGSCGIAFAMPQTMRTKAQEEGTYFYCPNGHNIHYYKSENARLKRELEARTLEANRQRENYFAEQRKHEQTQKAMNRLKKRTAAGVCPCCKRTFQQLSRHMNGKHPEFVKEQGIPAGEASKRNG